MKHVTGKQVRVNITLAAAKLLKTTSPAATVTRFTQQTARMKEILG